jgi:chemosensory pili system protein ChpA (sensor histidine kinase/response regulator)
MSETRDPNELMGAAQDIAPLAWVINEIRTSLGDAVAGVKAFLGTKEDVDSLRNARSNVHQANGALQLLDLRGVALVVDAIEQLLRRWESHPADCLPASVRTVETAIAAVLAYLDGLLSGRPNQPVRLFPYYRDVLQLSRVARAHPADLIFPDLSRRPAFHTIEIKALTPDQLRVRRVRYEEGLLGFLRDSENPRARRLMREALADLEHLPQRGLARSFWWIVRGLTEALDAHAVPVDIDLKRVLARLNLQLRRLIEGGGAVAERLMIDALYYVGRAEEKVPRVIEVRRLYGLEALLPPDFERATLTAVDGDTLRELKESIGRAKNLWAQIVNGINADPTRLPRSRSKRPTTVPRSAAPWPRSARHRRDLPRSSPGFATDSDSKSPRRCCSSKSAPTNCRSSIRSTPPAPPRSLLDCRPHVAVIRCRIRRHGCPSWHDARRTESRWAAWSLKHRPRCARSSSASTASSAIRPNAAN